MTKYVGFLETSTGKSQGTNGGIFETVSVAVGFKPYFIQDDEIETMKKNVASQNIAAEMVTISNGSDFTSTVTVTVTKDNGTQTAGGGTVTHKGGGEHNYAPTQAETNADFINFKFSGSGALTRSKQVYTDFPQTVDNDVLAAGATGFAAIDTVADAIKVVTDKFVFTVGNQVDSNMLTHTASIPSNYITAAGIAASALDDKGNWNIGKTGYSLTQAFPTNFADMAITNTTGLVDITQTAADKSWSTATRVLTAGTNLNDITAASVWAVVTRELTSGNNIVLAKGTGLTGLNDIPATDIVTGGAITTSSGNASVDVVKINGTTVIGAGVGGNLWRA